VDKAAVTVANPWLGLPIAGQQKTVVGAPSHTLEFALISPTPLHGFTALPLASENLDFIPGREARTSQCGVG